MLLEAKITIVIVAALIAAYTDFKKGYIYDWLNLPFIIVGAILAIFSPNTLWAFVEAGLVFLIGYVFYRTGKIGGGDIKFFAGLALYFPFYKNTPFILVVLLLASLFAILFYGIYYLVLLLKKPTKEIIYSILVSFFFAIIICILFLIFSLWYFALLICVFSFFAFTSLLLKDKIMQKFYRKSIPITKLLDDDLVDMNDLSLRYKKIKTISTLEMYPLSDKTYKQLKQILPKTARIIVYRNLPVFGPFIALGIIFGFVLLEFVNVWMLI